jgi:Arf-GAP/SH3 domain/ANK repeat/PH domain-containing protein
MCSFLLQMQNLQNMILFPLDSVLKGDIRNVKGDLRRPFDKALKDYETRHSKLEKVGSRQIALLIIIR